MDYIERCDFILIRRAYGFWIHMVIILVYAVFLAFLTAYVTSVNSILHTHNGTHYLSHTGEMIDLQPQISKELKVTFHFATLTQSGLTYNYLSTSQYDPSGGGWTTLGILMKHIYRHS